MEMGSTEASMMTAESSLMFPPEIWHFPWWSWCDSRWELDPPCTEAVSLQGQVPCSDDRCWTHDRLNGDTWLIRLVHRKWWLHSSLLLKNFCPNVLQISKTAQCWYQGAPTWTSYAGDATTWGFLSWRKFVPGRTSKRQKAWDDAYELHRIRAKGGLEELQPSLKMRKAFVGFPWALCLTCVENKCRNAMKCCHRTLLMSL